MPFKPTKHGQLLNQVAERLGCSIETVRNWEKEGAPITKPKELAKWLEGRKSGNDELEPSDLKEAKLAKIKAETKRIVFGLSVAKGEYTDNAEVARIAVAWSAQVRSEFMLLISEAPTWAGLDSPSLQDRAKSFVNGALGRLTNFATPNQTTNT